MVFKSIVRRSILKFSFFSALCFVSFSQPGLATSKDFPCAVNEHPWVEIVRSRNELNLWCGETVAKRYPVALGRTGWETELGYFRVLKMMKNPPFVHFSTGQTIDPGPDNPFGSRFIAFNWVNRFQAYQVIHGTPAENEYLVGTNVSHGCVRMVNRDVEQLYSWIEQWVTSRKIGVVVWVRQDRYVPAPRAPKTKEEELKNVPLDMPSQPATPKIPANTVNNPSQNSNTSPNRENNPWSNFDPW